jgi:hypothetical protein
MTALAIFTSPSVGIGNAVISPRRFYGSDYLSQLSRVVCCVDDTASLLNSLKVPSKLLICSGVVASHVSMNSKADSMPLIAAGIEGGWLIGASPYAS